MNYTDVTYSSVETNKSKFKLERKIVDRLVENILGGKSLFNYSNRLLRLLPSDALRYVSQTKSLNDSGVYRNALISFVYSCEKKCSGSGILFLMLLTQKGIKERYKKVRIEKQDIGDVMSFYLGKGKISEKVYSVFSNFGFDYNLRFSNIENASFDYNQRSALRIKGYSDPSFFDIKYKGPGIIVAVDGNIETVGEVDSLLQWSSKNKKPAILIANNISPDVSNTLKVNWESGELKVFPFISIDDSHVFNRVSKQIVSVETGLRVSNLDLDDFTFFDSIECSDGQIMISNTEGEFNDIEFILPKKDVSIHSIMKERVLCGTSIIKNACISGILHAEYSNHKIVVPDICMIYAKQAVKEWQKLEDISCVVTLQQKN